jgi:hypothetical protein
LSNTAALASALSNTFNSLQTSAPAQAGRDLTRFRHKAKVRDVGFVGKDGFEPPNSEEDRFTVCCRWPLGYLPITGGIHPPQKNSRGPLSPRSQRRDSNPRPADYKSAALPTELLWLVTHFARRNPRGEGGPFQLHPNRYIHSTLIHCFFWEGKGRLKCQIQKF